MSAKKALAKKAAVPLEKYRAKRDFKNTPEPTAKVTGREGWSFVVQEHHARSHHFDFRLEMDGVLVSWAVPKGIPEEPAAKRLAVHVEDHPLEYGKFAGIIPAGNYGAGTVAIFDHGEWEPLEPGWQKAFKKGKMKFILKGQRLQGVYLLARMGEEPNWLLRKLKEEVPFDPQEKLEREAAAFVAPQLARVVPSVPAGGEWLHEIKYDGYRLIAVQRQGRLRLFTRNELDWTARFAALAKHLARLSIADFVLDGEAVVFDGKGRSSFGDLQAALQSGEGDKIAFVAFDLLHFNGSNLRSLPLNERLKRLAELVPEETGTVRRSKTWPADEGVELFKQARANGLEGIISKNARARYVEGSRKDWAKSKCRARQEFIVCGYTPPKGSLHGFGALVLASFENGKLIARGKVGTGFTDPQRIRLLKTFKPLQVKSAPFSFPEAAVTWLKPQLVAEIEFTEITRDGSIRQGSFIALREDKAAQEVHLDGLQVATADAKGAKVLGIVITHPEREVYPGEQTTKLEVARHYERVGDWMLPYVAHRPLAVLRAPDGITGGTFFQKSFPTHVPDHVQQRELEDGTTIFFIKDTKGLVSLAQFGIIEIHPWGAPLPQADKPDMLIWDLDPDPAVPWKEVLGAAFLIRDFLADLELPTLLKTSGGKGLHLMLPIKRTHGWDLTRAFTEAVAKVIAAHNPQRFITTATKAKRRGKIFIDWMRNGRGSTCIAPWSLRARPHAPVSNPINWDQLSNATADSFTIHEPLDLPSEWKNPQPHTLTIAALRGAGLSGY